MRNEFIRHGWRLEFINRTFQRLTDDLISEYPIHVFIEEWAKTITRRLDTDILESIYTSLIHLGLRSDIAAQLERIVLPLQGTSYTNVQVIDTAIFYLLGKYKPLTAPNAKHLFPEIAINTWVNYKHNKESKTLFVCNLSKTCSISNISQFFAAISALAAVPNDHTLYFHTTSWKDSLNIMKGVNRLAGRPCLDFGIFPGFYMSSTVRDCIGWGYARSEAWSNEVAIMIFCIPNTLPSRITFKELVGQEWAQVTSHSRQCKDNMEESTIYSIDILYGDMVMNTTAAYKGEKPVPHTPPKKQLVSKTDAGDKFIHASLIGCVYFSKS